MEANAASLSQAAVATGFMSRNTAKLLRFPAIKTSRLHYHHALPRLPKEIRMEFRGQTGRLHAVASSNENCATKRLMIDPNGELPTNLSALEPWITERISNEFMGGSDDVNVCRDDIGGLDHAKKWATETFLWPLLRPDIFIGCRSPARGLLLFGPPGTGKTIIAKAIAGEAKATFFHISVGSIECEWEGESERLVRALFRVAEYRQPSVIFLDEVDSILSKRSSSDTYCEDSRPLKAQFLVEMDGLDSGNKQILVIGATSRPQSLDEAARSRFTKRLYTPLPSSEARACIIRNLLGKERRLFELSSVEIDNLCNLTEGYSGSDIKNLVNAASMGPVREASSQGIGVAQLRNKDVRPVTFQDFENSLKEVKSSISPDEIDIFEEWNDQFGSSLGTN